MQPPRQRRSPTTSGTPSPHSEVVPADRFGAPCDPFDDPVPRGVGLSLDEAFRVLEAIEDARLELRERGTAPGLQDELATVIRMLHGKLGFEEGGVQ